VRQNETKTKKMSELTARQIVDWHLNEANRHEELQRTHFNAASAVATAAGIELQPNKDPFTLECIENYVSENGSMRVSAAIEFFGANDDDIRKMVAQSKLIELGNKGWIRMKSVGEQFAERAPSAPDAGKEAAA
jgi:hypothetical protein